MKKSLFVFLLFFISGQSAGFGNGEIDGIDQVTKFSKESRIEIVPTRSDSFREWLYKYDLLQAQYDKLENEFQNRQSKGSQKKSGNYLTDDEYKELIHNIGGKKAVNRIYPVENQWMNVRFYNPLNVKIKQIEIKFIESVDRYKNATNEELSKNRAFADVYWRISDEDKSKSAEQVYEEARKKFLMDLEKQNHELLIRINVDSMPYTMTSVNFEIPHDFDIKQWGIGKIFGE